MYVENAKSYYVRAIPCVNWLHVRLHVTNWVTDQRIVQHIKMILSLGENKYWKWATKPMGLGTRAIAQNQKV